MNNDNLTQFCKDVSSVVDFKRKLRKVCVNVLPAAAIITFASTVMYWNSRNYGLVLAYAGKEIATVQDESTFEKATQLVQEQIISSNNVNTVVPSPECKLAMINNVNYVSPSDVKDKLLEQSQSAVENAFGLYVDGKLIGIVKNKDLLEDLLKNILENAKNGNPDATAEFIEKTEISEGLFLSSEICEINSLNKALCEGIEVKEEYVVQGSDTLESIAEKFNVSVESICENNDIQNQQIEVGQSLNIIHNNKIVHVKVCQNEVSEVNLPHLSVNFENPDDYIGNNRIAQAGQDGKRIITDRVNYIDGNEVSRENIENVVTTEPVDERISIGTKKREVKPQKETKSVMAVKQNQEGLCWPVPYTRNITSEYGPRGNSFHRGIDIAASGVGGKDIVAADDGVVETVANGGGYGNYLLIRHNNGISTLYAHCSSVSAKKGQKVSKGQTVAYVGSTGDSTGNHLHFEVREKEERVNPMKYFK